MESAIKVSINGGNQMAFGAIPNAELINVIECAMVKEVTTGINARKLLSGISKQNKNSR